MTASGPPAHTALFGHHDGPIPSAPLGPGRPTPPIALPDGELDQIAPAAPVPPELLAELDRMGLRVSTDRRDCAEAGRDWWPVGMIWATGGTVAACSGAIAHPTTTAEVAALVSACATHRVPMTVAGGRSGVCGGVVPLAGGITVDLTGLATIRHVDTVSGLIEVEAGAFGDRVEATVRSEYGSTIGHWPQSMALATVGGWVACRGAGQLSTRYGKIEDIVAGLEVVTASGEIVRTGGVPRAAQGPDLTSFFVGSEGTLGIVTAVVLRMRPLPDHHRRGVWLVDSFDEGLDAMRRIVRRGAQPAVMRLYDAIETERNYHIDDGRCVVIVLDEADPAVLDATANIVVDELSDADPADGSLVEHWLTTRNDVAALEALITAGYVVDTMEVAGNWSDLPAIYRATIDAIDTVPGTLAVSAHQSHSYIDGGCIYVTFAGRPEAVGGDDPTVAERVAYYRTVWDASTRAALGAGASLSHHHGIGANRSRFMEEALGGANRVLSELKAAVDPHGLMNPGKLGLSTAAAPGRIDPWT